MGRWASIFFLSLVFYGVRAWATPASRLPNQDFRTLVKKYRPRGTSDGGTAADLAQDWSKLKADSAPEEKKLNEVFNYVRDHRELTDDEDPSFPRRISWLYPADGCWLRATVASHWATRQGFTTPRRLFVFGNLELDTPNALYHHVTWWYHVAPVVRDELGKLMVIDPAIEPSRPMEAEEWVKKMAPDFDDVRAVICSSHTHEPFDDCDALTNAHEGGAESEIREYLSAEKRNLIYLNRDPQKELGEHPPWKP